MMRIIVLIIAALAVIGTICGGIWAYFNDTEISEDNALSAGTLDLKTDDVDGVSQTLYGTNISPGDIVGPSTIVLKNSGNTNGTTLDISFSYVESDGSPNTVNMSADDTAGMMEMTVLSYDGSNLLSIVSDLNINSYIDFFTSLMSIFYCRS